MHLVVLLCQLISVLGVKTELKKLTGTDDLTLAHYLITLDSPEQISEYIHEYLGSSSAVDDFASAFIKLKEFDQDSKQTNSKKLAALTGTNGNSSSSTTSTSASSSINNTNGADVKKPRRRRGNKKESPEDF